MKKTVAFILSTIMLLSTFEPLITCANENVSKETMAEMTDVNCDEQLSLDMNEDSEYDAMDESFYYDDDVLVCDENNDSLTNLIDDSNADTENEITDAQAEIENEATDAQAETEEDTVVIRTEYDGKIFEIKGASDSIKEQTTLRVSLVDNNDEKARIDDAIAEELDNVYSAVSYNIDLVDSDGNVYEPVKKCDGDPAISVVIKNTGYSETNLSIFHIDDNYNIISEMQYETDPEGAIAFETDSFSVYTFVFSGDLEMYYQKTDEEEYICIRTYDELCVFRDIINKTIADDTDVILRNESETVHITVGEMTHNAKLFKDINADGIEWIPIGTKTNPYDGFFDGQGHKITGIKQFIKKDDMCGVFGQIKNGSINNLDVILSNTQMTIEQCNNVGIVAARAENSNIIGCLAYGDIYGKYTRWKDGVDHIGGIVSYAKNSEIQRCGFYGSLYATADSDLGAGNMRYAGGIVSNCNATTITNCYAFAKLSANSTYNVSLGGICAQSDSTSITSNCYYVGEGGTKIADQKTDCYMQSYSGGKGNYNNIIKTGEALSRWDFENVWTYKDGVNGGYPFIKNSIPTEYDSIYFRPFINSYSKVNNGTIIRDKLDIVIKFDRDIVCNESGRIFVENTSNSADKVTCLYTSSGNELHIISDVLTRGSKYKVVIADETVFTNTNMGLAYNQGEGTGYSFSVTKVPVQGDGSEENPYQINSPDALNVIRYELDMNYVLTDDIDLSKWNNGRITAIGSRNKPFTGTIDGRNHHINGLKQAVSNEADENKCVGLIGAGKNTKIKNLFVSMADDVELKCSSSPVSFQEFEQSVGILMGMGNGELINCHVIGSVNAQEDVTYAGLLVGKFEGTITKCSATGKKVSSKGRDLTFAFNYTGGLVGSCSGKITDCFVILENIDGKASGGASADVFVGGVSGACDNCTINNCYAKVGSFSTNCDSRDMGGITGECNNGTVSNSYFYVDDNSVPDKPSGSKKSLADLKTKSTFKEWDFNTVWLLNSAYNDGYPILRSMVVGSAITYYSDSSCTNKMSSDKMLIFPAGVTKEEIKKELPTQIWIKSEESTGDKVFQASISWNIDDVEINSYPESDYITDLNGVVFSKEYENDGILQPFSYKVLIEKHVYQEYYDSYGMYPEEFFATYPDYIDDAYSDAVLNECKQVALEAMDTVDTGDRIGAGIYEGLNLKNDVKRTFRELYSDISRGLYNEGYTSCGELVETDIELYYDAVLMQIIKEYTEYDDSTKEAVDLFLGRLCSDLSGCDVDASDQVMLNYVAEAITYAADYSRPEGERASAEKLAKKATTLADALNKIYGDGKSSTITGPLQKYFKAEGNTKKYTAIIIELGAIYASQEIVNEELEEIIEQCDDPELKAALDRFEKKMDSPYDYICQKIISDEIIDKLSNNYESFLFYGIKNMNVGAYTAICELAVDVMRDIYELNAPSYESIYRADISNEYYNSISRLEESLRKAYREKSASAPTFEQYRSAYTLRLASLKTWLKNCSGILGSWDSTTNDNEGINKLIDYIDLHADIRRDLNGGKEALLGNGLTFYKYIGSCMYNAFQKDTELPTPIIRYEDVDSNSIRISIESTDSDMVFYYTVDGSIPVKSSQVNLSSVCRAYTGPFIVDRDAAVKVRGYLSGKIASDITTFYLRYDTFWDDVCNELEVHTNCDYMKDVGNHYRVPEKVFHIAKDNGINLKFTFEDGTTWEIESDKITDAKNLILKAETLSDRDIEALPVYSIGLPNANFMAINMSYDGVLGLTTTLKYFVGTRYAGHKAYLYFYNDIQNSFERQSKVADVSNDGYVEFDFTHCSTYVIALCNETNEPTSSSCGGDSSGNSDALVNASDGDILPSNSDTTTSTSDETDIPNDLNVSTYTSDDSSDSKGGMKNKEILNHISPDKKIQEQDQEGVLVADAELDNEDLQSNEDVVSDNESNDEKNRDVGSIILFTFVVLVLVLFGLIIMRNTRKQK